MPEQDNPDVFKILKDLELKATGLDEKTLTPQAGSSQDHAALPATGWDAARGLTLALACIAAALAVRRAARKKPSNQA